MTLHLFSKIFHHLFGSSNFDLPLLENLITPNTCLNILEIGCGSGRLVEKYAIYTDKKFELIDIDKEMISTTQKKINELGCNNVTAKYGSGTCIPYADNSFDLVVIPMLGIEEIVPIFGVIAETFRVLKPNGLLYFSTENPNRLNTKCTGIFNFNENFNDGTISLELVKNRNKGPYLHDLSLEIRYANGNFEKKTFEQGLLTQEEWADLLKNAGFGDIKISALGTDENFIPSVMNFLSITSRKIGRDFEHKKSENSVTAFNFFNNVSNVYKDATEKEKYPVRNWLEKKLFEYHTKHPIILDIGSGRGIVGEVLKEVNCKPNRLYGIEISNQMKSLTMLDGNYDSIWEYDLNKPIPIERYFVFDLITAIGVFEFIDNPTEIMKWIYNILRYGGRALLTFELIEGISNKRMISHSEGAFHIESRNKNDILELINKNKFEILSYEEGPAYKLIRSPDKFTNYAFVEIKKLD